MIRRKSLIVLESAYPFVFFTQSFSDPTKFREAKVDFFNKGLTSNGCLNRELPDSPSTVYEFLKSIFKYERDLDIFLEKLSEKGATGEIEVALNNSFSEVGHCQASGSITQLQDGEYFLQGFFVGVTPVKELEKSLNLEDKMLETILAGIGDAVCVFDRDFNILFRSPLHIKWFDDPKAFMCFKNIDKSMPNRHVKKITPNSGEALHLEVSTFPIKNEEGDFFAGINIVRDISRTLKLEAKSQELERIKQDRANEMDLKTIIGSSKAIQKVLKAVQKISKLDTVVYIQGDTGTGKELVSRAIHKLSLRADKPFLALNCGALSETLLDSELFGHIKGAFTGADSESTGLFEAADGGTLFLDEIGEMSMGTQVKLLRVLQDGEIRKLGSTTSKKVNVRVITATHRDIETLVTENKFREDLFYRIHVFAIHTPTLKERDEDILLLADKFLQEFAQQQNKIIRKISDEAMLLLKEYSWPGNVRELRNILERGTVLCETDVLQPCDLPISILKNGNRKISPQALNAVETTSDPYKTKIIASLEKNRWNKTLTAKDLKMSRATLWRKIKEYSLQNH
ncbi:MAG TPA: sigma 54-interacting transcriptional regulator [Nitrospinaceae bacterium]|jgi:transcriptional regulator with PAS, ATPase and Fis domain|nr:sigma 54-interacting transcriptional regulator [Nitrospinaceae bacterium]